MGNDVPGQPPHDDSEDVGRPVDQVRPVDGTAAADAVVGAARDERGQLRAVYRYVGSLGPAGAPAPAYVPPNQEPKPPFVTFPAPPK